MCIIIFPGIAAVYSDDDYGNPEMDSHWAKVGDTVTLRYVEEFEDDNPGTGEVYGAWENVPEGAPYASRAIKYRDIDYTVAALVNVPYALGYRYFGSDEFVLNDRTFVQDTGTDSVMLYAFDTTDEANASMRNSFRIIRKTRTRSLITRARQPMRLNLRVLAPCSCCSAAR